MQVGRVVYWLTGDGHVKIGTVTEVQEDGLKAIAPGDTEPEFIPRGVAHKVRDTQLLQFIQSLYVITEDDDEEQEEGEEDLDSE